MQRGGFPFPYSQKPLLADEPERGVSVAKRLKTLDRGRRARENQQGKREKI
ncbi:hypothetical protein CULT_2580003 [[Clostridium] ultunense Esp]|nr:hypothetical protein CULT_2580003 [[Clostridium] ultunense Esp]